MTLVTLAIVDKDNTPLYLCDFKENIHSSSTHQQNNNSVSSIIEDKDDDTFGFFEENARKMNESSSLKHQFVMHSALDRCEELVTPNAGGSNPSTSTGSNSMWIGFLGLIGETKVYGYMTTTKIKFLASIEDSVDNGRKHFAREAGLKALFGNIHKLYVEYRMNPFSKNTDNTKISSQKFDDEISELVKTFNDKYSVPS